MLWHIATVTYCHRLAAWTERGELWQVFFHGFHRIPRQREINGRIINAKHIHVVYASDFTFKFKESALSLTAARTQVAWRDSFFTSLTLAAPIVVECPNASVPKDFRTLTCRVASICLFQNAPHREKRLWKKRSSKTT